MCVESDELTGAALVLPEDARLADGEHDLLVADVDEHTLEDLVEVERLAGDVLREPGERSVSGRSASVELVYRALSKTVRPRLAGTHGLGCATPQ